MLVLVILVAAACRLPLTLSLLMLHGYRLPVTGYLPAYPGSGLLGPNIPSSQVDYWARTYA